MFINSEQEKKKKKSMWNNEHNLKIGKHTKTNYLSINFDQGFTMAWIDFVTTECAQTDPEKYNFKLKFRSMNCFQCTKHGFYSIWLIFSRHIIHSLLQSSHCFYCTDTQPKIYQILNHFFHHEIFLFDQIFHISAIDLGLLCKNQSKFLNKIPRWLE